MAAVPAVLSLANTFIVKAPSVTAMSGMASEASARTTAVSVVVSYPPVLSLICNVNSSSTTPVTDVAKAAWTAVRSPESV